MRHLLAPHHLAIGLLSAFLLASPLVLADEDVPLTNWSAPSFWSPAAGQGGDPIKGALFDERAHAALRSGREALVALPSSPLPFVAINPCRQYDSRSFTPLLDNTPRTVTLTGSPCGIPEDAQAVSANITVFNISGAGSNGVFKVGTVSPPTTAWINFPKTETQRANAGVVGLTNSGAVVVQVNQGAGSVDFTVDVNGYFGPEGAFTRLLGVGYVSSSGIKSTAFTNLGTWTSSRIGTGQYGITFAGLNPGCANPVPTTLATATSSGFVFSSTVVTFCTSGDTIIYVYTRSTANAAADFDFSFLVYGLSPAPSAFVLAREGRVPSTCTFTVLTGVETCE